MGSSGVFLCCFLKAFFHYKLIEDSVYVGAARQKYLLKRRYWKAETYENEQVLVKIAISPVDVEGASQNLLTELPDWDFDKTAGNARREWNRYLQKIQITTSDREQKIIFYTALYHTGISPNLFSDVDGRYRGDE